MRVANPYTPGFNQTPAVLAGRGEVTASLEDALDVAALDGRTPRPVLLVGSRGVGKTVLLEHVRELAAGRHSWISAGVEVLPGRALAPVLLARLAQAKDVYEQASRRGSGWRLERATIKVTLAGSGVEAGISRIAPATAPSDDELMTALSEVMEAATSLGAGLLLTIDEVHLAAKGELANVAAVLQHAVAQRWPLVAVLAGLPGLRDPRRMVTYLERGAWHDVGLLAPEDAREALAGPASTAGRPMDDDAADHLASASGGHPYAVQVLGHHAWRASSGAERVDLDHARAGDAAAQRNLASGLYSARWHDSSPREKEYLSALAGLVRGGRRPTGADVARAMDQEPQAVTYLRARLLAKGTVFTEGRVMRFAVPGMASWIGDQDVG